jgi:hypothetical protein
VRSPASKTIPQGNHQDLRVIRQRLVGRALPCAAVASLRCYDALNFAKSDQRPRLT